MLTATWPLGFLDGAVGFAYLLHIGVIKWHAAALMVKLAMLLTRTRYIRGIPKMAQYMTGSVVLIIATSMIAGINGLGGIAAALGFTAEFVITLAIINASVPDQDSKDNLYVQYAAGVAYAISLTAGIHYAMARTGRMPAMWGRYMYFNWTQPNVGGEMAGAGAIAAMIGLPRWRSILLTMILLADSTLLQARSGIIAEGMCIILRLCFDGDRKLYKSSAGVIGLAVVGFAIKGMLFGMDDPILSHVSSALMMDNRYRGMGSGFSGRSDLWDIALQLFYQSPIIGHGLGYYDAIGFIGPHNIVLFGLGEYGLTAAPFLICIPLAFYEKAKASLYVFAFLLATIPMFLFNDRFLDLNPYPFVVYILLAATAPSAGGRVIARPSPPGRSIDRRRMGPRQPRPLPQPSPNRRIDPRGLQGPMGSQGPLKRL